MLITKEGMESEVEESLYPHPPLCRRFDLIPVKEFSNTDIRRH